MLLQAGLICLLAVWADGKVYERCELARELVSKHEAPMHQVATWVCIAQHESQFNTSAVGLMNSDSQDHGIFQISDLFWCSPPGNGWACGVTCAQLEDDDIEDDFICAKRIYREHKKLSGDGFNAWVVYHTHCSGQVQSYIEGCFNETGSKISPSLLTSPSPQSASSLTSESSTTTASPTPSSSTTKTSTTFAPLFKTEFRGNDLSATRFSTEPNKPWFHWFSRFRWS